MVAESVVPRVERDGAPVFADVLAADLDWVRAEFDEIVSANFLEPPLRPRPRQPRRYPPAPPAPHVSRESGDLARTAREVGARERSPPASGMRRQPTGHLERHVGGDSGHCTVVAVRHPMATATNLQNLRVESEQARHDAEPVAGIGLCRDGNAKGGTHRWTSRGTT